MPKRKSGRRAPRKKAPPCSPLSAAFKALANPGRLKVFCVIRRLAGRGGVGMGRICREAGMKQPVVSHHVARLAAAGLVTRRKVRWWVYCAPSRAGVDVLLRFLRRGR